MYAYDMVGAHGGESSTACAHCSDSGADVSPHGAHLSTIAAIGVNPRTITTKSGNVVSFTPMSQGGVLVDIRDSLHATDLLTCTMSRSGAQSLARVMLSDM